MKKKKTKGGRPRLNNEKSVRVGFVITETQWHAINARARQEGVLRSELVRAMLQFAMDWMGDKKDLKWFQ